MHARLATVTVITTRNNEEGYDLHTSSGLSVCGRICGLLLNRWPSFSSENDCSLNERRDGLIKWRLDHCGTV